MDQIKIGKFIAEERKAKNYNLLLRECLKCRYGLECY